MASSIYVYLAIAQEKDAFTGMVLDGLLVRNMNVSCHQEAILLTTSLLTS